jgi:hypothetical protein
VCAQFVELCRKMGILAKASLAIDGSKFKAVNSRDNNSSEWIASIAAKTGVKRYNGACDTTVQDFFVRWVWARRESHSPCIRPFTSA